MNSEVPLECHTFAENPEATPIHYALQLTSEQYRRIAFVLNAFIAYNEDTSFEHRSRAAYNAITSLNPNFKAKSYRDFSTAISNKTPVQLVGVLCYWATRGHVTAKRVEKALTETYPALGSGVPTPLPGLPVWATPYDVNNHRYAVAAIEHEAERLACARGLYSKLHTLLYYQRNL